MSCTTANGPCACTGETNIETLEALIVELMPESAAAALVGLEVALAGDNCLAYKLRDAFKGRVRKFQTNEDRDAERDMMAEVLPTCRWLAFLDGYRAAKGSEEEGGSL